MATLGRAHSCCPGQPLSLQEPASAYSLGPHQPLGAEGVAMGFATLPWVAKAL